MGDRERRTQEREMAADRRAYEKSFQSGPSAGEVLLWAGAFVAALLSASVVAGKVEQNHLDAIGRVSGAGEDTASK